MQTSTTYLEPWEIKVVILGNSSVGKSSILQCYRDNLACTTSPQSTIGCAFWTKNIIKNDMHLRLQIWDTAGQEKYHSLAPLYYRGADIGLIVYDVTDIESYQATKNWANEIENEVKVKCIIGNKNDLKEVVSNQEVEKWAKEIGALFALTIALQNDGVSEMFEMVIDAIIEIGKQKEEVLKWDSENVVDPGYMSMNKSITISQLNKNKWNKKKDKSKCCWAYKL